MPPPPRKPRLPVLRKQLHAVVDSSTTMVCLDAAGQIRDIDEPFDTLAGLFPAPPFHRWCRTVVLPYAVGIIGVQRAEANTEIRNRPAREKRKGPGGFEGPVPPPPPLRAVAQVQRGRPSTMPSARVTPRHHSLTAWLPHVAQLRRARAAPGDRILAAVAAVQGTDRPPRVVSHGQLSRLVARGALEVWRGLPGVDADRHAEALRAGPLHMGSGIYGNGLYFTASRAAAARFAGPDGVVVRAALLPGARVVDWADLAVLMQATGDRLTESQRRRLAVLLDDPGRFAAAMGFDAVRLPNGDLLVVNRTALVVAR
jgi:hypothetical protein